MLSPVPPALQQFDVPADVREVLGGLRAKGFKAYLVGGCVRDMLRGERPKDYDIATSALPAQVQSAFRKVIPTGIDHGTVTVMIKGHPFEVTTFRKESEYVDGRRPSKVEFHDEIAQDLSRRDFTINAMAFDPVSHEFCDPFGGQIDLHAKTIRCVGSAHARFSEDGLRALRAVRFAARLGFALEASTEAAIPETIATFQKISVERVKEELEKLLTSPRPSLGMSLLRSTGLLKAIVPELEALPLPAFERALMVTQAVDPRIELRWSALLHVLEGDAAARSKEITRRLKFPNQVIDKVAAILAAHRTEPLWTGTDAELRRFMARVKREHLDEVLSLETARAWVEGTTDELLGFRDRVTALLARNPALEPRELAIDGGQIMKTLAIPPSRAVGEATRHLMEWVLEDPTRNTPEHLTAELAKWAKAKGI